jgi:hypothetical protein
MAVIPDGDPLWARTATFETYGGDVNKKNYQSQGAINPLTDVTAEQFSRIVEDLAAAGRTANFCHCYVTCNDSGTPAAPTIQWCHLMTAVRETSYEGGAPPAGFPTAARVSDGSVTITFAASYNDAYGVSESFEPSFAATASADTGVAYVTWSITGNVVTLAAFDSSGVAVADAEFTVEVS